jgi:HEAT repeat protein
VLRFKVLTGDRDPEVLGECFTGLLAIEPEKSLPLVASQLRHKDDAVRDFAALALGESRLPQALDHLISAWNDAYLSEGMRSVLARASALLRTEAAFDWLIGLIERGRTVDAEIAADALSVYGRNATLMQRVKAARESRKDA